MKTQNVGNKSLAITMAFACYPHERNAILRIMAEQNLKSTFDVVRLLASGHKPAEGDFRAPKKKSQ
jgi:hypothetical protein